MDDDNLAMVRSTGCLKVVTFLTLSGSFLCCSERYSVLQNTSNGTLIGFVYLYICIFVYFVSLKHIVGKVTKRFLQLVPGFLPVVEVEERGQVEGDRDPIFWRVPAKDQDQRSGSNSRIRNQEQGL